MNSRILFYDVRITVVDIIKRCLFYACNSRILESAAEI